MLTVSVKDAAGRTWHSSAVCRTVVGSMRLAGTWRDRRGRRARWPDLVEAMRLRTTRVVLAAAHLDSNPTNNRLANLRALCQRCHMAA